MSQFGTTISAEADKSMEVEGIINADGATDHQVPGGAEPVHVEEGTAPVGGTQHLPSEDADMTEKTLDKPDMPAAQQEHEPPAKPTHRVLNQVMHYYMLDAMPHLTAGQQGSRVRETVKFVIGDNLSILAGQVSTKVFTGWSDVVATMPGFDDEQVKGIRTQLEESGIGATNGKIQDIGCGFIVGEGFNWTDIARWLHLNLPPGKGVFVCDLAGYKIATHGESEVQTGKIIIGTEMGRSDFCGCGSPRS